VHHVDHGAQLGGGVGERADRPCGGDVDMGGAGVEAGEVQSLGGGLGGVFVDVCQQDGLADADAAGNRLRNGAGADDNDNLVGVGDGHDMPLLQVVVLGIRIRCCRLGCLIGPAARAFHDAQTSSPHAVLSLPITCRIRAR